MIRYFKKHIFPASSAIILGILTQLLMPLSAIMEQRMIDFIILGNMSGFLSFLWVAGLTVLGMALGYFLDEISEKWFIADYWESLRNDLYDGIMRRTAVRFAEKDTAVYTCHTSAAL